VALCGVDDIVVVDASDAVLVCHKDRAQDVRLIVNELERRGLDHLL
jgi:mannose-1-phosphate guanylyltransferase